LKNKVSTKKLKPIKEEKVQVRKPPGIDHYYVMEMLDQPNAVCKALNYGARLGDAGLVKLGGLEQNDEALAGIENLIIGACGTSFYAGQYCEYLLREMQVFEFVQAKIASEITSNDLLGMKNGGFLSVSQSGETMDLLIPFRLAKQCGLTRLNVVNKVMSTLAREENCGVFLNCGRELSVASTKAFISQVTVLTLVSLWFAQRKRYKQTKKQRAGIISELRFLSGNMQKVIEETVEFSKHVA
jgi:glutamine---fructose-6-phosphate transaminase (isomerizing)